MRILFILENYYPNIGGVETLFKALVDRLTADGYIITIITNKTNASLPFVEKDVNLKILRFPFRSRYLFTFLAWIPSTYYAFKNDLIHTTSYNAGIPAFIASVISRKKVIITFHEVWGKLWFELPFFRKIGLWLHYIFEKILLNLPFDRFVAVSKFTRDSLIRSGIQADKTILIYNGLNYEEFRPKVHENPIPNQVIYFGRLGISKGLDLLLESIKKLKEEKVEVKLLLVIPSEPKSFRNRIEEIIHEYKIEKLVQIKSNLTFAELHLNITESVATVIPSYSEGFCFTAVESIALGVPVISSNRGALKEVVCGNHLTMERHDADSLANAIKKALRGDWEFKAKVKFDLQQTIENYCILYSDILSDAK